MAQMPPTDRPPRAHIPRRRALYESRREREFYRYFEPIRQLTESGPPLCDLYDQDAVNAHQPISSPDRALTAFCQLGALRLSTRRAMLFFFDSNYAYVLAEATRTLSLQDDSVHEIEDQLWLGNCVIPRGFSICEETVCRVPDENAEQSLIHIINDIDEDTDFCDKPYVNDGPKAKFYAGVPITTPKGMTIGAYCCLDDKKREGLDEKGVSFLKDMAATVMTHLEMVRAKAEHERGTHMISGLGSFIEGGSTLQRREGKTERHSRVVVDRAASPPRRPRLKVGPSPQKALTTAESSSERSSAYQSAESVPVIQKVGGQIVPSVAEPAAPEANGTSSISKHADDLKDQLIATNIRSAFQRAADVIREAVDVDGVAFWDTAPSTYGGLVETHEGSDQTSDSLRSGTDAAGNESEGRKAVGGETDKLCKVLASSLAPYDVSESQNDIHTTNLTERFLRSLLRRNPHGKIWNFNQEGDASSDDDSSEGYQLRRGSYDRLTKSSSDTSGESNIRKARRKLARIDDGREIQRLFPGVRSLALTGMWDQNRGRWFSVCAIWTYSPLRLFSQESEVNYISAFCDVIMAEVHRLEAQNSDKAKSDFISSVSHELRSPLHGILGSVECLQDQPLDESFSSDLVSQIEVCGRTLVDIVDHLLDYSKINYHVKAKMAAPTGDSDEKTRMHLSSDAKKKQLGTMLIFDTEVELDHITEEVVQTAVYSFCCSRDKNFILDRKVAVILDIDRSAAVNWMCRVPLGGWKRICINLCSNALKYTSEGLIKISLKAEPIPGRKRRQSIVFSVCDSGRGMSKDFMENHLFKAFSQEDSLMEGTGLGMSLVAKIVKAMGGKIEVQSEKGAGSTMTVTVPVEIGQNSTPPLRDTAIRQFAGSTIALLGLPDASREQQSDLEKRMRSALLASIEKQCHSLGLHVLQEKDTQTPEADIYLVSEQDLEYVALSRLALKKPLIVICNTAISLRKLRTDGRAPRLTHHKIEYIAQPCGTERLSKAVNTCLTQASPDHISGQLSAVNGKLSAMKDAPASGGALVEESNATQLQGPEVADSRTLPLPIREKAPKLVRILSSELQSPPVLTPSPVMSPPAISADGRPQSSRAGSTKDASARPATKSSVPPPSGLSLLLVEDNPINLQLLVNYARKQGHAKAVATDGQQAVDAYKAACLGKAVAVDAPSTKHNPDLFNALNDPNANSASVSATSAANDAPTVPKRPDVVLMDINMPILTGFEATRLIRAFEREKGLKPVLIIALTGLGSAAAQQEAFSSGVDLFLTKPVRLKELTKILAEETRKGKEGGNGNDSGLDMAA